jgi:hypothetical protein
MCTHVLALPEQLSLLVLFEAILMVLFEAAYSM